MKILFIHDHIFTYNTKDEKYYSSGGLINSNWNRYLQSFNEVTVVARGRKNSNTENLKLSSAPRVKFDLLFEISGGFNYYLYYRCIREKIITNINNTDLIVLRMPSNLGYFTAKILKKYNKPYVVEVVGCAWDSYYNYGSLYIKALAPFRFFRMKEIVKNSLGVTYVTKEFLQNRYPYYGKLRSFYSNVELKIPEKSILDHRLKKIKTNADKPIKKVGIIGNISVKYKGFDIALKALKKINKPEIILLIVGGGDKTWVSKLISKLGLENQVKLVGSIQGGEKIFEFIDDLDLLIHPSKQEGLPRVVIEALSRGCPVLASSVAGIPELIADDYLHKPGDYVSLSKQMNLVIQNDQILSKMAKDNFEKAKNYYPDVLEARRNKFFFDISENLKNEENSIN